MCMGSYHTEWLHPVFVQIGDFKTPITLAKVYYNTRYLVYFEAL
jgi:hypothetical protein